uniref:Uncharacterized protein n=1 Tax=Zooxanthella nutricula TaxID=1333877 RepID=A0A7S2QMQ7_9DINO
MVVSASRLLGCLQAIRDPSKLQVLVLAGLCIDGTREDTTRLLRGLSAFGGLCAVALRFNVPSTFGALLPQPRALVNLRRAWPLVATFALGDKSLHGFDYWPEQITDFKDLYPHGNVPEPLEVFTTEFRHVFATQYGVDATAQWAAFGAAEQDFWARIARRLPTMPHSEVRRRVAELFQSGL